MSVLRVTPIQTDLLWHQPKANREQLAQKLRPLTNKTDLVVLPEMFTSGFTRFPEDFSAAEQPDSTLGWMRQQAQLLNAALAGSVAVKVGSSYVNRFLFVRPDGQLHHYDKVHLFRMACEHKRYEPGNERVIIEYKGWRILLTVCYDLRFPVFCRNRQDYDLMLCVANWPASRRLHWRTLLQARAIENQAFVVGVNRIGVDGNGLEYSGDSLVVDSQGELLQDGGNQKASQTTVTLDKQQLMDYRQAFPVWQDADSFYLRAPNYSEVP